MPAVAITSDIAVFGSARDEFAEAMREVPPAALSYLKQGDDYSTGGLVVHVNHVLEHYLTVLESMAQGRFGECRPVDRPGLEEEAAQRSRSALSSDEVTSELTRMNRLHREVEVRAGAMGADWARKAAVWYPGASEPFPTSPADVLGWLTGHYREHVPHVRELVAIWQKENDPSGALSVVDRFSEAFGRGDVDGVMALMTEDCIFENTNPAPDGERYVGQDSVRRFWERFFSSTENPRFEAEERFAAGDRVVVRWRFSWGEDGSAGWVRGVDVFKVRDGKVAEKLAYVKG
jgi:ketosteroid isomerase-like protein